MTTEKTNKNYARYTIVLDPESADDKVIINWLKSKKSKGRANGYCATIRAAIEKFMAQNDAANTNVQQVQTVAEQDNAVVEAAEDVEVENTATGTFSNEEEAVESLKKMFSDAV